MDETEQPSVDDEDALRYGAGLPRVGTRLLGEEETLAIQRRVRRSSLNAIALGIGVAGSWAAGALLSSSIAPGIVGAVGGSLGMAACASGALGALGALLGGRWPWRLSTAAGTVYLLVVASLGTLVPEMRLPSEWLTWSVVLATVLLGNGYLALRVVHATRLLQRRGMIRFDLEGGVVEQYAGCSTTRFVDDALRRLAAAGWVEDPAGVAPHRLELLPTSGLVLRVDGRALPHIEMAHVADVAPTMPHALRVSLPDGLAPTTNNVPLELQRRSLTPAERDELGRHIRKLRGSYRGAAAATLATAVVVGSKLWPTFDPSGLLDISAILWYGLTLFAVVTYGRRLAASRKLEADRKLRWVVTVDDRSREDRPPVPPKLEVLPISQLAWTENASPAGWRISRL